MPEPAAALRGRIAAAIRDAACPGDCGKTEEECAKERIQPFVWHHGRLAVVEGEPEMFADAVLAVLPPPADRAAYAQGIRDAIAELERDAFGAIPRLRRLAAEAQPTTQPDGETDAPRCDHCKQPGHSFEDCPHADEPATTCTCGDAGDCFVPAGHYADCPDAAGVRQDGAAQ